EVTKPRSTGASPAGARRGEGRPGSAEATLHRDKLGGGEPPGASSWLGEEAVVQRFLRLQLAEFQGVFQTVRLDGDLARVLDAVEILVIAVQVLDGDFLALRVGETDLGLERQAAVLVEENAH